MDQKTLSSALNMPGVKNVIAIASGKGGVGKSTVTTHMAYALKEQGLKVGVVDADIYGPSQTSMLGSNFEKDAVFTNDEGKMIPLNKHGVKFISMAAIVGDEAPVVWRAPMAVKAIDQFLTQVDWGELDYLLLDLPPGTGDIQLTLAQKTYLSGVVIVTTPQNVAVGIAKKGLRMFKELGVPIMGVIENMSGFLCESCGKENFIFSAGGGEALAKELDLLYLGGIPIDPAITKSGDLGEPVFIKHPQSKVAEVFHHMAKTLKGLSKNRLDAEVGNLPKSISAKDDGNLMIEWNDGKCETLSAHYLRTVCPCAACVDENTGERILDPHSVPLDIKILSSHFVGRYGLGLKFSDGHGTGIFKYTEIKKVLKECQNGPHSCEEFSV